ncbi:MAG: phosphate signaling complex protein PhoU, partial [Terrimicrobiaceae bacterium]|nr:phosphate signaling complex protein PhoU [Terrimicrobiaceae bacterium]
ETLMMASLAKRSLENARKGLFERDEDWCNTVIADDEEIDTLEVQVDRAGLALILRYQPVASDLREVVAAMKLSVNLERAADQAVNIARRGRRLLAHPPHPQIANLQPIFSFALRMFDDAIRAYADKDLELARGLRTRDHELDRLNREYAERLTALMADEPMNIPVLLDLIFIARFLERVGDQSKNIGEDTVFAISAEETRHSNTP